MKLHFITLVALANFAAANSDCQIVWNTGWTNNTIGPSHIASTQNIEVADDFDSTQPIGRLFFEGHGPLNGSYPVDGVWVRFYAWTPNGPGALQHQRFLAAGDPNLGVLDIPETIDVRLVPPFQASGKHFISVQVDFAPSGGYWYPWIGSGTTPQLSAAWVRDNNGAATWGPCLDFQGQAMNVDASFTLQSAQQGVSCDEWVEEPTPVPNMEYSILRDITVIGPGDVWAVGHYQRTSPGYTEQITLGMHHDGTSWTVTPTPSPAPGPNQSNDYLWAVSAIDSDDVWAGGEQNMQVNGGWVGSQPLTIHWDGASWTEIPSPVPPTSIGAGYTGSSVLEIEAIETDDVWFLGRWVGPYPGTSSTRPAMAMHWDGSSFTLVPTPVLAGTQAIHAADAFSSNEIWAVGGMTSATTPYPYVLRWDGSNWSHVVIPPAGVTSTVFDVAVLAPNNVWISAQRLVGTTPQNFLLHYNGTAWSQIAAPTIAPMHVTSSNDIWLAGSSLHHFDGSAWRVADGFGCVPSPSFAAISGVGSELWAAGRQLGAGLAPLTARRQGPCGIVEYCTSSSTTNGCHPAISGVGVPSASASSGFEVRVAGVEGQRQGLIFYGASGSQSLVWAAGSTSYLCVKAPTQRLSAQNSGGNFGSCNGLYTQDWNAFMASHPSALGSPRAVGQVFNAQGWLRDPIAPKTTNLSNALEFTLQP